MQSIARQRLAATPLNIRAVLSPTLLLPFGHQHVRYSSNLLPIATKSFWLSLIPKPLRSEKKTMDEMMIKRVKPKSKGWNPATFYIVIFILIGSMAINMISLRQNFATFMRRADVRIGLLREVVEKLQRGEEVDVEKTLGTGVPEKELEWEEVLKDIERDYVTQNQRKHEKAKQADAADKNKPRSGLDKPSSDHRKAAMTSKIEAIADGDFY